MEEILELLRKYNERHPEYLGLVGISIMDDGSGHLTDHVEQRINGSWFSSLIELKKILEND